MIRAVSDTNFHAAVSAIPLVLDGLVNPTAHMTPAQLKRFGMEDDPTDIPLPDFLQTFLRICHPSELVAAFVYIRRLLRSTEPIKLTKPSPQFTTYNAHRILFTSVVLANIQWCDSPYSSESWAKWSTVWSRYEVDRMKLMFLKGIDWDLNISRLEFIEICEQLADIAPATAWKMPRFYSG
eukprot:Rmarinus@m.17507